MEGRLASSWISNPFGARAAATAENLPPEIEALRHRGWRGGVITPHRAFAYLPLKLGELAASFVLAASLSLGWLAVLGPVGRFWGHVFVFWTKALRLEGAVVMMPTHWGSHIHFALPYVNVSAGPPGAYVWWLTAMVVLLIYGATCFMPDERTSLIYLLRFLVILQVTALIYFALAAARFPHDLPSYTEGMFLFGSILIAMVPWMLGFTFYIFDFTFLQKLGLTLLTMGYLTVFLPFQYMLHVYILNKSILFMPLLYFAFGPFLDVLIFVCLYSWGMSWGDRVSRKHERVFNRPKPKLIAFSRRSRPEDQ
jgi:hypothetical protein